MKISLDILSRKRWWVILPAGIAVAVVAGVLLSRLIFWPAAPDASTAELSKIARFTETEAFLQMNSKERGEFADALMSRYLEMSPEEQARAREMFHWLKDSRAAREAFWLSWAIKRAEEFAELSESEQDAYVDKWLDRMAVFGAEDEMREAPGAFPSHRNMPSRSDVDIERDMRRLLAKTSAEDRPRIAKLSGAIIRRIEYRQGR